jgi:hypothetical protein
MFKTDFEFWSFDIRICFEIRDSIFKYGNLDLNSYEHLTEYIDETHGY